MNTRRKLFKSVLTLSIGTVLFGGVANNVALGAGNAGNATLLTDRAHDSAFSKLAPSMLDATSGMIDIIVQLSNEPIAPVRSQTMSIQTSFSEQEAESSLSAEQASFKNSLNQMNIPYTVHRTFNQVFNGMALTVDASRIEELASIDSVKKVFKDTVYHLSPVEMTESADVTTKYDQYPLDQIHVPEVWAKGFTGKGIKVGVLDTGVDYDHPDLKSAYKGGYDFVDKDNDPYETTPAWGQSKTDHGTHVSGTILGRAVGKDVTVRGIVYDADLYSYRVLGPGGSGPTSGIIAGIEQAVKDKMDVINLSLGEDPEKDPNGPDAIAVNNAVLAGVTTVIANGNAATNSRYYYTVGQPATAQLPIAVGAASSPTASYIATATATVNTNVYANLPLKVMAWKVGNIDFASIVGSGPQEAVFANLGSEDDFSKVNAAGKIAVVSRGTLNFVDKAINAKKAGAKALVIFNGNALVDDTGKVIDSTKADLRATSFGLIGRDGAINSPQGEQFGNVVPAYDMAGDVGRKIASAALQSGNAPFTLDFGNFKADLSKGDLMASFSSRGPNSDGNFGVRPDLVAPGVSILSSIAAYGKYYAEKGQSYNYDTAYGRKNGTSMATPHVTGLSALLKQAHPEWDPFDIRAALANTAEEIKNENNQLYDIYSQGSGRVNVLKAIETPALLQAVEPITILDPNYLPKDVINYAVNTSFGLMSKNSSGSKQLRVKNVTSNLAVDYTASVEMHPSVTGNITKPVATPDVSKIRVSLSKDKITSTPNGTVPFALQVSVANDAADGVYEGEVKLTSAGQPDLHLPFVIHVGDQPEDTRFGFQQIELSDIRLTPNHPVELNAKLTATDVNYLAVEAYDFDYIDARGKMFGTMVERVSPDNAQGKATYFAPGPLSFNLDGTFIGNKKDDKGKPVFERLAAGKYKIKLVGKTVKAGQNPASVEATYEAWKVLIVAPPFAITGTSLNRTNGITATVQVAPYEYAATSHEGLETVVFQLMKGNTPVGLTALKKDFTQSEEVTALFNVTGSDYTVNVFVVDSLDSSTTNVGNNLADSITLK
ncbi:S8 family serine peptidase [Paenibacillus planticolens]|uniref:S8 family serine peptidase n=1 Tax=Paenibacillus planticolens TaxID=2654976 RepID=UPI001492C216|nr:S8 family serine peptidase [Paenibacillus planticolens]